MTVMMSVATLSGCGMTKEKLGFAKQAPDEFMVMSRAPLSLPPEFDLRPVDGIAQPQAVAPANNLAGMSAGEQKLMSKVDVENGNEDIKAKIDQEFKELNENN